MTSEDRIALLERNVLELTARETAMRAVLISLIASYPEKPTLLQTLHQMSEMTISQSLPTDAPDALIQAVERSLSVYVDPLLRVASE